MEFLAANPLLAFMLILIPLMFFASARGRKKLMAQQEEHKRQIDEALVPGAWVQLSSGFWGRYIDTEGDIIVLETPDGTETYWSRAAVVKAGESPFADLEELDNDEPVEEEMPIMGMETSSDDTPRN